MLILTHKTGVPLLNSNFQQFHVGDFSGIYNQCIGHPSLILDLWQEFSEQKAFNMQAERRASVTKSLSNKICLIAFKNQQMVSTLSPIGDKLIEFTPWLMAAICANEDKGTKLETGYSCLARQQKRFCMCDQQSHL